MAYLDVAEIQSALENLAVAYPDTAKLITCPFLTHENRQSHLLRIGTAGDPAAEGVLLLGGVHAREWVPPDALVSLAADLLEAYHLGTGLSYGGYRYGASDVRQIMESADVFVFACVNPDGRQHSQTENALWRKNRWPHAGGGSCIGVDLNRNFDFLWDHLVKFAPDSVVNTSADPCSDVYRGPMQASEPETRNVVWTLENYSHIRWLVDVHSAVPVILHSWGSDEDQTTDPAQNFQNPAFDSVRGRPHDTAYGEFIARADLDLISDLAGQMNDAVRAVRGDDYGVAPAYGLYPTSGASDDYAFSRHFADSTKRKTYGFTIECGHTFQPTWAEAENVIREVSSGLITLCLAAAAHANQEPVIEPIWQLLGTGSDSPASYWTLFNPSCG